MINFSILKRYSLKTRADNTGVMVRGGLWSVIILLFAVSCSTEEQESTVGGQGIKDMKPLTVYSPAPPSNMLHILNLELVDVADQCASVPQLSVIPVALPNSINDINQKPDAERQYHLPIVTAVDFLTARDKTGPEWHAYDRANKDLKLVAKLYDIGFAMLAFDPSLSSPADLKGKRIGVPPRPSSIRVLSEALLRDGWGILDDVELVDLTPPQVAEALASGRIDATTWNLVRHEGEGYATLMPNLLDHPSARWIGVDEKAVAAMNEKNPFVLSLSVMGPGKSGEAGQGVSMLSFAQALTAWDKTDGTVIKALLGCILKQGNHNKGLNTDVKSMLAWPGLTPDLIHPAALEFYRDHNMLKGM